MKATKLITAALLATLALAACNKDDDAPKSEQVDIRTTICATTGIDATPDTRATIDNDGSGTFATGDELGLYACVGSTAKLTNSSYKVNETALFWDELSKTEAVRFSAYYPKVADIADPEAYAFNAATAARPDLLVATPVTASKGETVTLDFRHAMHRLVVNVTTNVPDWDAAQATITLKGMNAAASINILMGVTTPGEASEADGDYAPQTGAATTFIIAPQKVSTGADWIQIELGGKTFTYPVPAQYTKPDGGPETLSQLNSGETLTLTLNVKRDGVTLTSGDISAWDMQGTIDDTIDVSSGANAPVTTADELMAAIAAATGTEDHPTKITLGADVTLPWGVSPLGPAVSVILSANKHIEIDGGGYSLFPQQYAQAFWIEGEASLKLFNVTIDGQDAERNGSIIQISTGGDNLTLGAGFKLTGAKLGASYPEVAPYGIDAYDGTLVIEDGAEISGCGKGMAIQVANECSLRLKGGKVSGNSGYGLKLQSGSQPVDARIENTLPANARFENCFLGGYLYGPDTVYPGFETVITAAPDCTLTAADLDKFTLKRVDSETDSYELYLEDNAIKLRKKN